MGLLLVFTLIIMKENYLANVFDTTTVYLKSGVSEIIAVITLLNLNKLII